MSKTTNKRPIIVGFFVLIGIVFLITGILLIGNMHETFKKKMRIITLFDDVGGLQAGNNVWFSGVKIGTVSKVLFYGSSQVEVSMKIDVNAQQYIRKNAKVKLGSDGFIGNKILLIYGGTSETEEVQEGDTLQVEKTFSTEDMVNTLQHNNENLLAITTDFKTISNKLASGEGTIGKFLNDNTVYANIDRATASLQSASVKVQLMVNSLSTFSDGLNKKGTLAHELTSDTIVFNSMKLFVEQIQQMSDTASIFISNLKEASSNQKSTLGVLLHDEEAGTQLKETIKNLESSSKKLDEDLEALQHNVLLKGYFKKKQKANKKVSTIK